MEPIPRDERGRLKALPPALAANLWKPGHVANPSGKGGSYHECLRLYRDKSPEAAARLCELIHSDDERVAFMASDKVMERAWGKPKEYDPKAEQPAMTFDPSRLSAGELALLKTALQLMAKASMPAPEIVVEASAADSKSDTA